jgi:hypothetical protein
MKIAAKFLSLAAIALTLSASNARAQAPAQPSAQTQAQAAYQNSLKAPAKSYRLTYTITETDSGKPAGTQHYTVIVLSGGRTTLKQGSKIPVATGSYNSGSNAETQFTYLDVGLNIDASLDEAVDGMRLHTKIEQSSVGSTVTISGVNEPMIRQTVLDNITALTPGKPVMLGTLDIPDSTRRMDIEVLLEPVK